MADKTIADRFANRPIPEVLQKFPFWLRCRQRILVVTDGLNFGSSGAGFDLVLFLAELSKLTPTPEITKAHLFGDPDADIQNFNFATNSTPANPKWKPVTTANYDQIWLFGVDGGGPISSAQIQVIANFMEMGGGLFATGDHQRLGYSLCGELPRVRKMRDWATIPMVDERIDTVWNRDPSDSGNDFHDQSDDLPQRIFPLYYGSGITSSPHPLLRSPIGDINVLPDHPHESICSSGQNLAQSYTDHGLNLTEFPVDNGSPLAPEVIASSVSAGRYLEDAGKPPTTPRFFGAISVWDGHRVAKGRLVCDATWHHFIDVNLNGNGSSPGTGSRNGLRRGNPLAFTDDYFRIAHYYRNIGDWIIPVNRRWCRWWVDLVIERFTEPLFEEWQPLPPHPCPWEIRVERGTLVERALNRSRGAGFAAEFTAETLVMAGDRQLVEFVRPVTLTNRDRIKRSRMTINIDELRRGLLGTIFDAVAQGLPRLPQQMKDMDVNELEEAALKRVTESVTKAKESIREYQEEAIANTQRWLRSIG